MKKNERRSLQVNLTDHKLFGKLAAKHNKSMIKFFSEMVSYFRYTGADPSDLNHDSASAAIKALDKRIIGFIKTQEKEKLTPILEELAILIQNQNQMMKKVDRLNHNQLVVYKKLHYIYMKYKGFDDKTIETELAKINAKS